MLTDELHALETVRLRVAEKEKSYKLYNFSATQNAALRAFFDLAQEYEHIENFYRVCVIVPVVFLDTPARLYLLSRDREKLSLVCDSNEGVYVHPLPPPQGMHLSSHPYSLQDSLLVPVKRKPDKQDEENPPRTLTDMVMGMLEIPGGAAMDRQERFFYGKYANRIGFNLHNRLISEQNVRHLNFINNLVMDIEHNVITPNIYFRHLFNKLRRRLKEVEEISAAFSRLQKCPSCLPQEQTCRLIEERLDTLHGDLAANHRELLEHYNNYSLFLESLFRRDHFKKGHLVLKTRKCAIEKEIISAQLDHYGSRLVNRGIHIAQPLDMRDEEIPLRVDVGLLSQVYANFFSNAVKYTTPVQNESGEQIKVMAYGREYLPNYFGTGQDGIKFNVFTTGEHLPEEEMKSLFTDGFRGKTSKNQPGTGHGLSFVKQVIEIHGGVVGYEPTSMGNNFFFILPMPTD